MSKLKKDLIRELDILKARYDTQVTARVEMERDRDHYEKMANKYLEEIEALRKENRRLEGIADSEQALRCVRMPYLDEQVRILQEQLEKAARLCEMRRVRYDNVLTVLRDMVEHSRYDSNNFRRYIKKES